MGSLARSACFAAVSAVALFAGCNTILGNQNGTATDADAAQACVPRTCDDLACGPSDDGCGGTLQCGECLVAGFGCTDGRCLCQTSICNGRCGFQADGCQGEGIDCGQCDASKSLSCGGGELGRDYCGSGKTCVPRTCDEIAAGGALCGKLSDGCGNMLDCGACQGGQVCGGGGVANTCGCVPKTCAAANVACGTYVDPSCPGVPRQCGGCPVGQGCTAAGVCSTSCVPVDANEACQGKCNNVDLGCGQVATCPQCAQGNFCVGGNCCDFEAERAKACTGSRCGTVFACNQLAECDPCTGDLVCFGTTCQKCTGPSQQRCETGGSPQCCNLGFQICGDNGCCNANNLNCGQTSSSGEPGFVR